MIQFLKKFVRKKKVIIDIDQNTKKIIILNRNKKGNTENISSIDFTLWN